MVCAWKELLSVVPSRLRSEVDKLGREQLQDLRLRLDCPAILVLGTETKTLGPPVTREDLQFVVNTASQYSPWAASTVAKGYITAPGGHRIGICGVCTLREGNLVGIREIRSVCIRVARDFPGIGEGVDNPENTLILGPPGSGKTTLLRDLIRIRARSEQVCVVDERGELFPASGDGVDVLSGCGKGEGIEMALRTMGPQRIAMDEITSGEDCAALLRAGWCGVGLLATAHAKDADDLFHRPVYEPLARSGLFTRFVILGPDKSCRVERRSKWR